MTLLFVKSYKNEAHYELQVEAVPRIQLCRLFPPLRGARVRTVTMHSLLAASRRDMSETYRERCHFYPAVIVNILDS